MPELDLTQRIDKRIREAFSGPRFTRKVRRAELLLRNPAFLESLEAVRAEAKMEIDSIDKHIKEAQAILAPRHPDIYKNDPPPKEITAKDKEALSDALSPDLDWLRAMRKKLLKENEFNWHIFCANWGIERCWSGDPCDLNKLAVGNDSIVFQCRDGRCGFLPLGDSGGPLRYWVSKKISMTKLMNMEPNPEAMLKAVLPPMHGPIPNLQIFISPSTQRAEIMKAWSRIEKLKKEVWGFPEGDGRTFRRDLCFWDLRNMPEYGRRPFQSIADRWNREWPRYRINRIKVYQGSRRIQDFIDRLSAELPDSFLKP